MKRKGKVLLVLALVAVVAMAFRVSWNALRDVARAVGADSTASMLYPFVVDGLMALALVATLVLAGRDRKFALRVLATYTIASLVLNYVHGLVPALHARSVDWGRLAEWDPANWALVLLATSLPVGSIYFGSDLVAKVLHHRTPIVTDAEKSTQIAVKRSTPDLEESTPTPFPVPVPRVLSLPEPVDFTKTTEPGKALAPVVPIRRTVAAQSKPPRRATGRVPDAARTSRPTRTADELLTEARELTTKWSDRELTAEALRKGLRTAPVKARMLRDLLRTERALARDRAA
ncbi:DUF2637 domain-containing protein [Streptomyces sp. NPDC051561]|uniref:DUF2637 domain-containing protein n=1 Tax=Streptomyces sp. NPDC051561 TaxID=3365658 RepID=UPI0037BD0CB2